MLQLLTLSAGGYIAQICPQRGANLVRLARPALGMEALRTPTSLESFEKENPYLWGVPILFFPNRISGAAFDFDGRRYEWPMNEPATGCFLHGTIHETPFDVLQARENRAVLRYQATKEQPYLMFDHAFTMTVTYDLLDDGLSQTVAIRNDSPRRMPVALGFHTTFRIPFVEGGDPGDVRLFLSCGREIVRDMSNYLPTGEVLTAYEYQEEYRSGEATPCSLTLSRHYEMTHPAKMVLRDRMTGARITYLPDEQYRYWMVYNGGSREFICVEPQTWINNCPNAPFKREETGFDSLNPGEERQYRTVFRLDKENEA